MPHIPRAICGECNTEMKCDKNGVNVEMLAKWGSYYKIEADQWVCPKCGKTIIIGFADQPFAEHFQPDYEERKVDIQAEFWG